MTAYQQALSDAMTELGRAPETVVVGRHIPESFDLFPITGFISCRGLTDNAIMGVAIGLALTDRTPLLLADMNAILNMLDGYMYLARSSDGPACIIRCVAHKSDYTMALQHMTTAIRVYRVGGIPDGFLMTDLATAEDRQRIGNQAALTIGRDYAFALSEAREGRSTVLVEYSDL